MLQLGKQAQRSSVACPGSHSPNSHLRLWAHDGRAEGIITFNLVPSQCLTQMQAFNRCSRSAERTRTPLMLDPPGFRARGGGGRGRLPAQRLHTDIHQVPTVHTALGWGLEGETEPKQEQEA